MDAPPPAPGAGFDIAVIGAGVVGCAIFREFVLAGARTVLVEAAADILEGASKANSAILHTGFDAEPGSLEAACIGAGNRRYREIHHRLGLPLEPCGALVLAWSEAERERLGAIRARAGANGVEGVRVLSAEEVRAREPALAAEVCGAAWVAGEAIIDPWQAPLAYAVQGLANGGALWRDAAVTGGRREGGGWRLETAAGAVAARVVVNCAGLRGDLVEAIARPSPFSIRPRRGEFLVFDKRAARLARAILLPIPTARTKGVVLTRTVFGNLLVGPTAEEQPERSFAPTTAAGMAALLAAGRRVLPALAGEEITAAYAGLRPASEHKDYVIEALPAAGWITVGAIRSTGLSAALGIAGHVRGLHEAHFGAFRALPAPAWPAVPALAESASRPWRSAAPGEIVCHCEQVTAGEIRAACAGPLAAGTLGGLKRRTRVMMGRCQGFYCTRRVLELACARLPGLAEPLAARGAA